MNGNYSWQEHQANERLQARLSEAEIHRSLKRTERKGKLPFSSLRILVLLPVTGIAALMKWLTSHDPSKKPRSIQKT